jgi:tRNA pseudouridine55 synthase
VFDFLKGEVLLIDKPIGWSSFDVVNRIRWQLKKSLGVKKIKVGHAGTLDPLASGLLIICTGKKTKEIESFMGQVKTYTGSILIGKTTPSYDLETEFNATYPIDHITEELICEVCDKFIGIQEQLPPIFSAKKINGKRAYELAREGREITLKSNSIEIFEFKIDSQNFPSLEFEIKCSKGTYIRSIAHDFGIALNSGACLTNLCRTKSGEFKLVDAKSVDEWISIIQAIN